MIKIKLCELFTIIPSLNILLNKELPSKYSFPLSKLGLKLGEDYRLLNIKNQELAEKYAKRDNRGNVISTNGIANIKEEFQKECNQLKDDLYNYEIEIEFNPISIGEIDKFYKEILKKEFVIEGIHLMNLQKFVIE